MKIYLSLVLRTIYLLNSKENNLQPITCYLINVLDTKSVYQ